MKYSIFTLFVLSSICLSQNFEQRNKPIATNNIARFGYYWMDNTLPYDSEFSYYYDVAVYPDGVFSDTAEHYFAYITAQNKHIIYDGVPYSVEVALQYGYNVNNINSIKRVWMNDFDDGSRFSSWWIDSDADGVDYWELSTLDANGYLGVEEDTLGDVIKFLRVQAQTIFISETTSPIQSTWENRFYFYNFTTNQRQLKVKDSFTIPANRQAVRNSTYSTGSGIWAGILETEGDEGGPPDFGKPPIKKMVYKNRWVKIVDQGVTSTPNLDSTNNWWIEPQSPYQLFYRSQPIYSEFVAGNADYIPVELISLSGTVLEKAIKLEWVTASETNNKGFEIERLQNYNITELQNLPTGQAGWTKIGYVEGKGTTTESQSYSYEDKNLSARKYMYRLKQIDYDGSYKYSQEVEVEIEAPKRFELIQNYPNPFNPTTTIKYSLPQEEKVVLKVFGILGNEIATLVNEEKQAGSYEVEINGTELSSGVYFYRMQAGEFTATKKFILLK